MNLYYLIMLLIAFLCLYLWIGNNSSKNIVSNEDYFLMGRDLNFFSLTMTFFATMLGGGVLVGASQAAYLTGWSVIIYPAGTAFGFLALGLGFGARLRNLELNTIAEIFEKKFKSRTLRTIAGIISTISLFAILISQGIAIKSFFITIGLSKDYILYIFWSVFVAYTTMGGFKAVVKTDMIQAIFMLSGLLLAICSIDFAELKMVVSDINFHQKDTNIPWDSWFLKPMCFILIGQDMGQRCFATKNSKTIAPAAITAGMMLLLCSAIAICFGIIASKNNLNMEPGENILISSVINYTSPIVSTIVAAVIIMAIASTADSLLCSISSNICYDLSFVRKKTHKVQLYYSRIVTFILGIFALVMTIKFDNIVNMLMLSYEISISTIFAPIFLAVLTKKINKISAYGAIITGGLLFVSLKILGVESFREVYSVGASFIVYFLLYFINDTKHTNVVRNNA